MFSSSWALPAPTASADKPATSPTSAAPAIDVFDLSEAYGAEAASQVASILSDLETAGFSRARVNAWSAFDRVLGGIAWLLHHLVRREDAARGRVQWDVLFQSHEKMKPRLGLAQEAVRCIEMLAYECPVPIQPHQLLLQDFGDIATVQKLVRWLLAEAQDVPHLDRIRQDRQYLAALDPSVDPAPAPPKKEVQYLQDAYKPRRRWRYAATSAATRETEDALIQRCLLEYGERVSVAVDASSASETGDTTSPGDQVDFLAQLAGQAAAIASQGAQRPKKRAQRTKRAAFDPQAADFDRQYQKAAKQALEEQQALLTERRERERELLQSVVGVPEDPETLPGAMQVETGRELSLQAVRSQLKEHEAQIQVLIEEKRRLEMQTKESKTQAAALDRALSDTKRELSELEAQAAPDELTQRQLATLRRLVGRNEALKREKTAFRAQCRSELAALTTRVEALKRQVAADASQEDEETRKVQEIELMHAQMALKHKEMKTALGAQTRALQLKLKQVDEIPTRIELVQYEKRFVELYDEVALTLDETRKYYCVYNTLKSTLEFLEKEVSLLHSIHDNFDVAMGSKPSTQAFFTQMESIIHNVQGSVAKQQAMRDANQTDVDTLDSKYQLLLERERMYVNAVREFQKECEKNEKLAARLQALDHVQQ